MRIASPRHPTGQSGTGSSSNSLKTSVETSRVSSNSVQIYHLDRSTSGGRPPRTHLASERSGQRLDPGLGYADTFGVKQRVALGALQLRYAGDAGAVRRTRCEVHHSGRWLKYRG